MIVIGASIAALMASVLFSRWAVQLPLFYIFIIYFFLYFIKIMLFFITRKFSIFVLLLELGLIVAAAIQVYCAYGIIWCLFFIVISVFIFPFFYKTKDDMISVESSSDIIVYPKPQPDCQGSVEVSVVTDNEYGFYFNAESRIRHYAFENSIFGSKENDSDIYDFICKMHDAMAGSMYSPPLLDQKYKRSNEAFLYAFYHHSKGVCGLEYKQSCVIFPANKVDEIILLEYTCRGSYWYCLGILYDKKLVKISFSELENDRHAYHDLLISLAIVWNAKVQQDYINFN